MAELRDRALQAFREHAAEAERVRSAAADGRRRRRLGELQDLLFNALDVDGLLVDALAVVSTAGPRSVAVPFEWQGPLEDEPVVRIDDIRFGLDESDPPRLVAKVVRICDHEYQQTLSDSPWVELGSLLHQVEGPCHFCVVGGAEADVAAGQRELTPEEEFLRGLNRLIELQMR